MELAKQSLEIKRKVIEQYTAKGLYPYSKFYLRHVHDRFGCYWKNHFSTIGINGMNECCLNFLGVPLSSADGLEFSKKVMNFMRDVLAEFQDETGNIYNLEATPAESTAYRFAKLDTAQYPDIIVANHEQFKSGAKPYYTNSTHLPAQAAKQMVRRVTDTFRLPYITLSPSFSICPSHGYMAGEHFICPKCGAKSEVFSRIVGYMRPVSQWNDGKREEFADRKLFDRSVLSSASYRCASCE